MNLYIVELMSPVPREETRKLAVHAHDEGHARHLATARYSKWNVTTIHERTGPAVITFEEGWVE